MRAEGSRRKFLRHRNNAPIARSRSDDQPTGPHRDCHRLFDQHGQPQIQRLAADRVERRRIGHHVHRLQFGHLLYHRLHIDEDLGADAEELLRFDGGDLGVVGVDIADRAQLDEIKGGAYQLLQAVQVASAHPAAADQSHTHFSPWNLSCPAGEVLHIGRER